MCRTIRRSGNTRIPAEVAKLANAFEVVVQAYDIIGCDSDKWVYIQEGAVARTLLSSHACRKARRKVGRVLGVDSASGLQISLYVCPDFFLLSYRAPAIGTRG